MWAFDLPLWGFVHVDLCPMGFCPCGLLSGYRLQNVVGVGFDAMSAV